MILIIAEKAQAAKKIATALADGEVSAKNFKKHPYYEITWKGEDAAVVPLRGHIMSYDYPAEFNKWSKIDPKDLIEVYPKKKLKARTIAQVVKKFSPDLVIHACDADAEGENIGFEAIELLGKPSKRAWFHSLAKDELKKSFEKLREPDENLSRSIDARMIVDLMFGAVLTREVTLDIRHRKPISVGRCQTPTLKFLVDKELKIKAFKSKKFWEIIALLEKGGVEFEAQHAGGRFFEKEKAQHRLKQGQPVVVSVKSVKASISPPIPLNTTYLLRCLNAFFNISASKGMKLAENLYLGGYITYPRTDTNVYPKGVHQELLQALKKSDHGKYVEKLLSQGFKVTQGKKDVGDHPPVMPTKEVPAKLDGALKKVYDFILRHYLATLSPAAQTTNTKVDIDISGEPFTSKGTVIDSPGFLEIYPFKTLKIVKLPTLKAGDKPRLISLDMKEGETKPPPRYSEGTLIKLMEKEGIGTKSTRQEHIETLKLRGYAKAHGKILTATELGIQLIRGLTHSAERITLPEFTRTLEQEMEFVARGRKEVQFVVNEARKELRAMVDNLRKHKEELKKDLREAIYKDSRNVVGTCPACGKELLIRFSRAKKRFVGCSGYPSCTQTYSLPQKGVIAPTNKICEKCKTPIISVKRRRTYETCLDPNCPDSIYQRLANNKSKTDSGN